ncbi:BA75_02606T0 [Komagataella pastoris]|uniref:U3 small nucleolar ribonucleoprotein protein MPP10 n=1 Tax=Komagataella pastoris TaxID=4922 RepID=A0A1B2JAK5_PICPA|nr:BA75_02606T0 [Komagataella pastoris]
MYPIEMLEDLVENPCKVFSNVEVKDILKQAKQLIDPISKQNSVLDEVYIDGLASSQVWAQIKLVIDGVTEDVLFNKIPELKEAKQAIQDINESSEEDEGSSNVEEEGEESESDIVQEEEDDESEEEEAEKGAEENEALDVLNEELNQMEEEELKDDSEEPRTAPKESNESSDDESELIDTRTEEFAQAEDELNDEFFDLEQFQQQVIAMEKPQDGDDDDEEIDYFGESDNAEEESDNEEVMYYNQFFDPKGFKPKTEKKKKKVTFDLEEENDLNEEDQMDKVVASTMEDLFDDHLSEDEEISETGEKNLSTFERQQREIQKQIAQLEQEQIAQKKWTLTGEASVKTREADALLEEDLDFERTSKPVPVITQDVTESIEDLIRKRISNNQFDELQKRLPTNIAKFKRSERVEVSEQKSTKSLAELYEEDYVKPDSTANKELEKAHDEISQLYETLSHRLDSLCSAHFIPKPAKRSLEVKVQTDTITMEDAQPLTLAGESTFAPQEVYKPQAKKQRKSKNRESMED